MGPPTISVGGPELFSGVYANRGQRPLPSSLMNSG